MPSTPSGVPRIESLKVLNYRALKDVQLRELTPLTVLLGPNGSGKSTIFDVFNFLSECFQLGLRSAWDKMGRSKELRSRNSTGPIVFNIKYRERPHTPLITYHLAIEEGSKGPVVAEEYLSWKRGSYGAPFRFLDFRHGVGNAISGEAPDESDVRVETSLTSPDLLAVSTLGQFSTHPRVAALRQFISDWYVSYLSIDRTRDQPEAGPQDRLSKSGDNLPNVLQYLTERHPGRLDYIFSVLKTRIPRLERVDASQMPDGRLLLQIKDGPFAEPILSRFASDGTLKMLAYLTVLHDPEPPRFIGIEEPENFLHPRLLFDLAEECRAAAERSQLLVTTHSPFLIDAIRPHELRVMYRDVDGYSRVVRASDIRGITAFVQEGAALGSLWTEGYFGMGDPLQNGGAPMSANSVVSE